MLNNFMADMEAAKEAEQIVLNTFSALATGYTFQDVSEVRECWYKGDILATAADGRQIYIEVKDDKHIGSTRNVLCEDENYLKEDGRFIKGNMYNDTDIYCVVSKPERCIYVFDFKVLKDIYKRMGEFKVIPHQQQDTYCFLLGLHRIKQYNGLIAKVNY